jgi:hypothetical protein
MSIAWMFPVASPSPKLGLGVAAVWEELVVTKTAKNSIRRTTSQRPTQIEQLPAM